MSVNKWFLDREPMTEQSNNFTRTTWRTNEFIGITYRSVDDPKAATTLKLHPAMVKLQNLHH